MLTATELCLVCATTVAAVAQNKLRVSQLQAVGPGLITEHILQAFSSSQLCTCPGFGQDRVNFHQKLGGDTAGWAD